MCQVIQDVHDLNMRLLS